MCNVAQKQIVEMEVLIHDVVFQIQITKRISLETPHYQKHGNWT